MITTPFGFAFFLSLHVPCEVLNSLITTTTDRKHTQDLQRSTYPELVIMSWRALLNESTIVCCNISMMRIFLQHIYLQFYFFLFILKGKKNKTKHGFWMIWFPPTQTKVKWQEKHRLPSLSAHPPAGDYKTIKRATTSVLHSRMGQGGVPACSSTTLWPQATDSTSLKGCLLK